MMRLLGKAILLCRRVTYRLLMGILRMQFRRCGRNVRFDPYGSYTYGTIELGDDVFIGPGAVIRSSESTIRFGSKIMLGPNVMILGGDHNFQQVGRFMYDVKEKRPGDDLPVVVEDDVWIGAGVIILKGVTLRRGSVVAAGAVVTKTHPAYSIIGGVPAKVIGSRFDAVSIAAHEAALYSAEDRTRRCVTDDGHECQ